MNKFSYKNLTPFKWFVLENFPFIEADFDALTDWQIFCKLGKEINKIIDSQNVVGTEMEKFSQAFIELKNYVDTFFENLDVQEEVNKKLNEMAEDGTLDNILQKYINNNVKRVYNTLNELINDENLVPNLKCETLGYYTINDNGKADYIITESKPNTYYVNLKNGNYAQLISNNINVNQFGAYGDGIHNDTEFIQNAIDYCEQNSLLLNFNSNSIYLINTLNINGFLSINGNMATLKANTSNSMINIDNKVNRPNGIIENIIFDMNFISTKGLNVVNDWRRTYNNLTFNNSASTGAAIHVGNGGETGGCYFSNLKGYGNYNLPSTFMIIDGPDNFYTNIDYQCYKYGFKINKSSIFNNIHGYVLGANIYEDSYFMEINNSVIANNLYPDTQHHMFVFDSLYDATLNSIVTWFNTGSVDYTQFSTPYIFYLKQKNQLERTTINNSSFKLPTDVEIYKFSNFENIPFYGAGNVFRNTPYTFPSTSQDFSTDTDIVESHVKCEITDGNSFVSGYVKVVTESNTQDTFLRLIGRRGTFNDQRIACPYWTEGADISTPSGFVTVLASKTDRTLKLLKNSNMKNSLIYINIPINTKFVE